MTSLHSTVLVVVGVVRLPPNDSIVACIIGVDGENDISLETDSSSVIYVARPVG